MDPYALLEVEPGASEEVIRKAWKRLAREHHPDLNPGDPQAGERFKRIKEAYDLLMDGGGRVAPAGMDADWVDSVEWMAEVRRREVMQNLLPRFVGHYGLGATLVWALQAAGDLEAEAAKLGARRRSWAVRRMKLEVVVDDRRGAWGLASIERRSDGRVQLVLFAEALWRRRPADEADLRRVVFAAVDHGLAAAVPVALKVRIIPRTLEEALRRDRRRSRDLWFWRLIWAGVAVLSAVLLSWAS